MPGAPPSPPPSEPSTGSTAPHWLACCSPVCRLWSSGPPSLPTPASERPSWLARPAFQSTPTRIRGTNQGSGGPSPGASRSQPPRNARSAGYVICKAKCTLTPVRCLGRKLLGISSRRQEGRKPSAGPSEQWEPRGSHPAPWAERPPGAGRRLGSSPLPLSDAHNDLGCQVAAVGLYFLPGPEGKVREPQGSARGLGRVCVCVHVRLCVWSRVCLRPCVPVHVTTPACLLCACVPVEVFKLLRTRIESKPVDSLDEASPPLVKPPSCP